MEHFEIPLDEALSAERSIVLQGLVTGFLEVVLPVLVPVEHRGFLPQFLAL
eukprot:CAMPEP_0185593992 /NCGR_PEP_ID=MMETSP0434-20130131/73380_1 /TAXON_ID=626734 ORGANISM="Favella taraikaensis, Strain Fe Narragansett Bay" /NCGR_SAMPLE_ID=MMETSP0434 /ASSEMBLY_ACC=CAM_ASM_000379 /LENGTH=50 /DNA_ID=CAMNT_0028220993 /DNA_START=1 /DNA_END=153 /DNA_ORIENTATION=+